MPEQSGGELYRVGACHHRLHDIDGLVHTAAQGQGHPDAIRKNGDDVESEQQVRRIRELNANRRAAGLRIDVSLIEAIEQDEAVSADPSSRIARFGTDE